ncbi:hypothetical protein J27TS7_18880 [Paenibacillus dendritiformis]|nr:hypothetical protein J27TS7_18880 [Paenibacillus dendritiformis]
MRDPTAHSAHAVPVTSGSPLTNGMHNSSYVSSRRDMTSFPYPYAGPDWDRPTARPPPHDPVAGRERGPAEAKSVTSMVYFSHE